MKDNVISFPKKEKEPTFSTAVELTISLDEDKEEFTMQLTNDENLHPVEVFALIQQACVKYGLDKDILSLDEGDQLEVNRNMEGLRDEDQIIH